METCNTDPVTEHLVTERPYLGTARLAWIIDGHSPLPGLHVDGYHPVDMDHWPREKAPRERVQQRRGVLPLQVDGQRRARQGHTTHMHILLARLQVQITETITRPVSKL